MDFMTRLNSEMIIDYFITDIFNSIPWLHALSIISESKIYFLRKRRNN